MIQGYLTAKEAADLLGYTRKYVEILCVQKKLAGAIKFANAWAIPEQTVHEFKPGLQGFAAMQAQKRARQKVNNANFLSDLNAAIQAGRKAKEQKENGSDL